MDVDGGTFCAVLVRRSPPGNSLALLGHFSVGQIASALRLAPLFWAAFLVGTVALFE
jgi:hypothetical protein